MMGKRFKVSKETKAILEELFEDGKVVFDDQDVAREIGRSLAPLRDNGDVYLGRDRKSDKTIGLLKREREVEFRRNGFDSYVLELLGF